MALHVEAMVGSLDRGAEVFDYGNSIRDEARTGGLARAFDVQGFVPAYLRPLSCEGKGPFRWSRSPATPPSTRRPTARRRGLSPASSVAVHLGTTASRPTAAGTGGRREGRQNGLAVLRFPSITTMSPWVP